MSKVSKKKKLKALRKPRQVAAIDVGSTSVRLRVAELQPKEDVKILEELVHPVAIGSDTFTKGYITPPTLRAITRVLGNFSQKVSEYQADCLAVATSALREAANCDLVVDRIRHLTGIELDVLDAVEESRMTCQMLLPFLDANLQECEGHVLFIDLGGGSTETLLLKKSNIVLASNRRLGTSRLFQSLSNTPGDKQMILESIIRNVVSSTLSHFRGYYVEGCVIANSLVYKAALGIDGVIQVNNGVRLPMKVFRKFISSLKRLSNENVAETCRLTLAETELFIPALFTLERLFDNLELDSFYVADLELLDSMLYDLRIQASGQNPLLEFSEQVVLAARGLGMRYGYDEKHSCRVAKLAVQIYDDLEEYLDLSGKDKLYLEVAGILHDIGMFINEEAHHKHSQYIIQWAELVGFNREERNLIAMISRYHRKALPGPSHVDYTSLPLADRLRVNKLAAILRVADALDRPHRQQITSVKVSIDETSMTFHVQTDSDLIVERVALQSKGTLLQEVTGLNLQLIRDNI